MFRTSKFLLFSAVVFLLPCAQASDSCDYYKEHFPDIYAIACNGSGTTKTSQANATLASAATNNVATLPTEPTPYGLENITSYFRRRPTSYSPSFALIKGFQKFGAGITTGSDNTFYGNDVMQRTRGRALVNSFDGWETPKRRIPNFNFGTAISLIPSSVKHSKLALGLSLRYNHITDTVGWGTGVSYGRGPFTFGIGTSREKISNEFDRIFFLSASAGVKIPFLAVEYLVLKNVGSFDLRPIHIITGTATIYRLMITAAVRRVSFISDGEVWQNHFAIQYRFSKKVSAGFLWNYIPGTNSLAAQFYL